MGGGAAFSHSHCREFDPIRLVEIGFELYSVGGGEMRDRMVMV